MEKPKNGINQKLQKAIENNTRTKNNQTENFVTKKGLR